MTQLTIKNGTFKVVYNYLTLPESNAARIGLVDADKQAEAEEQEKQCQEECLNNFKKELGHNSVTEINKKELKKWIKDCDKALLDNILAYFRKEEGVKASAVSTKRNKVVDLVVNNRPLA